MLQYLLYNLNDLELVQTGFLSDWQHCCCTFSAKESTETLVEMRNYSRNDFRNVLIH